MRVAGRGRDGSDGGGDLLPPVITGAHIMPSTHVPPPKSGPPPPIQWPACPACGEMLRRTTIEPHERYTNLDVRNFACDCGLTTSDVIARL